MNAITGAEPVVGAPMSKNSDTMMAAMTALTEKVARLERHAACLEEELRKARAASVQGLLGPLRLRGAVLVYFGPEPLASFVDDLDREFDPKIRNDVMRHLFDLHCAPFQAAQREAFRASFRGGMYKWSRPPSEARGSRDDPHPAAPQAPLKSVALRDSGAAMTNENDSLAPKEECKRRLRALRMIDIEATRLADEDVRMLGPVGSHAVNVGLSAGLIVVLSLLVVGWLAQLAGLWPLPDNALRPYLHWLPIWLPLAAVFAAARVAVANAKDAPRTWSEALARRLAQYNPIDKTAYRALQQRTRSDGFLDRDKISLWCLHEREALRRAAQRPQAADVFLNSEGIDGQAQSPIAQTRSLLVATRI